MKKKKLYRIVLLIASLVFVVSSGLLIKELIQSKKEKENLNALANIVNVDNYQSLIEKEKARIKVFNTLYEENNDFIGWLKVEGTHIDYPVMYTPNEPEYYLRRDFNKNHAMSGLPFIGMDNTLNPPSDQVIIYSHNMKDGTMFSDLTLYEDSSFWEEHKIIQFSTMDEQISYEIFSAFYTTVSGNETDEFQYYNFVNAENESVYNTFIHQAESMSLYDTEVNVEYKDQILTLSTCAYHENNGRFVLMARRIK